MNWLTTLLRSDSGNSRILVRTLKYVFSCLVIPIMICAVLLQSGSIVQQHRDFVQKGSVTLRQGMDELEISDF